MSRHPGLGGRLFVVSGAAVTTITFSGLNGDAEGAYEIGGSILNGAGGATDYTLEPNGLATNQRGIAISSNNGAAPASGAVNALLIGSQTTASETFGFRALLIARRGAGGRFLISDSGWGQGAANVFAQMARSEWREDTVLVTSLLLRSSVASGFGIGTFIWIRPAWLAS